MSKKSLEIIKRIIHVGWPIALLGLLLFISYESVQADSSLPGVGALQYIRGVIAPPNTGSGEGMAIAFVKRLIQIVRYLVGGLAVIMGILYGMSLVFARGREEAIAKQKTNFIWIVLGFVILIISENVAGIFNPETARAERLIDFDAARDQLRDIVDYLKWLVGSIVVLFMTISSIRMIVAQGDEEATTKQKRNLTWSVIGMLFILLANSMVNAIYFINAPDEVSGGPPQEGIELIASVVRLILVFLGPAAIAFTIIAGIMYLTALDNDERMQKAKRMIVAGITAVVVIYAAYTIVNTIASSGLTEPATTGFHQLIEYVA